METRKTILVVDDQQRLVDNIALLLEMSGYDVLTAGDGVEALEIMNRNAVHLIIADIAMPRMNGYQLYEIVRENKKWGLIPFVFLTARKMNSDIRYGKQLGVDDYLVKPIEPEDLLVVVKGKLRRSRELHQAVSNNICQGNNVKVLTVGKLRVDKAQHRVWIVDREISLSPYEFKLLEILIQNVGSVLSPVELVQSTHAYKIDAFEAGTIIRPLIFSLRRKLDAKNTTDINIENVRGVGYRLVDPEK
jgi:DNA-binding response OmpR family regulator